MPQGGDNDNALIHWYTDALVHWCTDTLVHWYTDTWIHYALIHWYTDTLVIWNGGDNEGMAAEWKWACAHNEKDWSYNEWQKEEEDRK